MDSIARETRVSLSTRQGPVEMYSLEHLEKLGYSGIGRMPFSVKVLLESVLRQQDGALFTETHLQNVAAWKTSPGKEVPFLPARVIMQDFTGVPAIVDLAAMRDSLSDLGGDPEAINPVIPVDMVIDHSVQVDRFGSEHALAFNAEKEFERNRERYEFLNWASKAFKNFSVVPPATGIVHQVNLEYLATVVRSEATSEGNLAFPDTLVGTDSHTTMINGLGVLGWGVGGIEAEAAVLGQPMYITMPDVVGVEITGDRDRIVTATDIVLRVTQMLRELGVVGKFVEFYGDGLADLSLADRATISNMCPEYGATAAFFPVDDITLSYLRNTGRDEGLVDLVESYTKKQGLFRVGGAEAPEFTQSVSVDLGSVVPSIAGPKRPQDRISLPDSPKVFQSFAGNDGPSAKKAELEVNGKKTAITDGSIIIAAITSCTNTSNPSVMIAAGLLAKRAVEHGLKVPPYVKTSLAPGSRVVTRYLDEAGLTPFLNTLGFNLVGYGCTTCIGNSGPVDAAVSKAVGDHDLIAASVLSGNRNFEGRIHPEVKANFLASPPLVVAFALAGRIDIDLTTEPVGRSADGSDVYLRDIWPTPEEVREAETNTVTSSLFDEEYSGVYTGNEDWNAIEGATGSIYDWQADSTYIKRPPFFEGLTHQLPPETPITGARVLAHLGESVTTDHISPAGVITPDGPAGLWLESHGVPREEFNSFGSRRGNHEVMMRGTFANIRIKNGLVPGVEGGYTTHMPSGEQLSIYDAAMKYKSEGVPLVVLAGKDYGMGSSRDWAAKGTILLGVQAVIAESYERIHRSNLVGMGVLPLQYMEGETAASLGLTGEELFDIEPPSAPGQILTVTVHGDKDRTFKVKARIDTDVDMEYYRNGGILHTGLRNMGS